MQVSYAIDGYWLARERDFSPHTVRDYQVHFRRLQEFLGASAEFEEITTADINRFLNHCKKKHQLGAKTMSNAWTALSSLWTWAEDELKIPHVIRGHVSRPRYKRAPIVPYTEQEVKAMLESCDLLPRLGTRPSTIRKREPQDGHS